MDVVLWTCFSDDVNVVSAARCGDVLSRLRFRPESTTRRKRRRRRRRRRKGRREEEKKNLFFITKEPLEKVIARRSLMSWVTDCCLSAARTSGWWWWWDPSCSILPPPTRVRIFLLAYDGTGVCVCGGGAVDVFSFAFAGNLNKIISLFFSFFPLLLLNYFVS